MQTCTESLQPPGDLDKVGIVIPLLQFRRKKRRDQGDTTGFWKIWKHNTDSSFRA